MSNPFPYVGMARKLGKMFRYGFVFGDIHVKVEVIAVDMFAELSFEKVIACFSDGGDELTEGRIVAAVVFLHEEKESGEIDAGNGRKDQRFAEFGGIIVEAR